ncbi:hypothetical protein EVAR_73271_1, partial [Eumeta japonica]
MSICRRHFANATQLVNKVFESTDELSSISEMTAHKQTKQLK